MGLNKKPEEVLQELKFNNDGLIPAVVQDVNSSKVLMLAYMNKESILKSLETGRTCFYSRSREELWLKGETSGNYQYVEEIYYDCDADTLLIKVRQKGNACHTGAYSCFYNKLHEKDEEGKKQEETGEIIGELYELLESRYKERPEGSYTTYLFNEGRDKILKKVGEEAAEVIIASKNDDNSEVVYEVSDLVYHCLVMLVFQGIKPDEIYKELEKRYK